MTENIQSLLSEVQELRSEISSLKAALEIISQGDSSSGNELENAMMRVDDESLGEEEALAPFSVFYEEHEDIRSKGYYIFVPQGCVLVNGEVATFPDADDDRLVALPNLEDEGITTLYAHVNENNEVSFDGEEKREEDAYCFQVGVFGENYVRICSSLVHLGGDGGGTLKRRPNPFEVHLFDADASEPWDKGYAVWMEDLDHLASINGKYATIENIKYANVYDANTGYGSWYFLDDETLTFGQTLYLVLTPDRGESEGPKARLQTKPGTDADSVSVAIATIDAANIGGELEPRDIWQHVTSAVIVSTGGGGTTDVASETIVALDMDCVTKPEDADYEKHKYAIRLKRGYLKNVNGELAVKEDSSLTLFIETTPYTGEQPYVGDL
jgi:hypothetical protein